MSLRVIASLDLGIDECLSFPRGIEGGIRVIIEKVIEVIGDIIVAVSIAVDQILALLVVGIRLLMLMMDRIHVALI